MDQSFNVTEVGVNNKFTFKKLSSPEVVSWQAIDNGTVLIVCFNNLCFEVLVFEMFKDVIHEYSVDNFVLFVLKLEFPNYLSYYLCNCLLKILLIHHKVYLRFFLIINHIHRPVSADY